MARPGLLLPGNLARSLRPLDDPQLEELLPRATAEAYRHGSPTDETGGDRGHWTDAVSKTDSGPSGEKRASGISPGVERVARAVLEAGVKPAAIAKEFRLDRTEVQRIAKPEGKR